MEEKSFEGLKYLISYPDGFQENCQYPLVVFLHGAGTRSEGTEILSCNSCFLKLQKFQEKGYILMAPLCQSGDWNEWMNLLIRFLEEQRRLPFVDATRVHLTGNSMGGYGTWELGSLRPDWLASLMPVCGGGLGWMAQELVNLPIRTFHGLRDTTVDPIESLQMAKAVNKAGGHAELILFPSLSHNCWDAVYSNEENIDWLLSFTTERDKTKVEQLSGSYYG